MMNRRLSATLFAFLLFVTGASFTSGASAQVVLCDPQCTDGFECNAGECNAVAGGVQAETSAEPVVTVELTHACVPSCRAGYGCEAGVCVVLPGVACIPDCRAGYSCESGSCMPNAAPIAPVQPVPVTHVVPYPTHPTPLEPTVGRRLDRKIRLLCDHRLVRVPCAPSPTFFARRIRS